VIRRDPLADPRPLIRAVHRYATYVLGEHPDVEDITSETLERAIRYRASYDPSRGAPATWMVGIARNVIAARRSQALLVPLDEADELVGEAELEARTAETLRVRAAIAALPERDRELVALRWGADLTARQIGELLDLRTNAVEVALHRVSARLREVLRESAAPVADSVRQDLGLAPDA
jgi:RNA polymerase sigma-70 factor (ECF subfamily)